MGSSWVFSADVSLPAGSMAAYLASSADLTQFEKWPRDFQPDEPEAATVSQVLDDVARFEDTEVVRRDDGLSLRAIASNDGDLWLTLRAPIAAAIRAAHAHGGTGELVIYNREGDPSVYSIRVDTGTAEMLRGAPAHAARARASKAIEPLEDRIAERFQSDGLDLPPEIASIHARVVEALSRVPDDALLAVAEQSQTGFRMRNSFRRLVEHFPEAGSLRGALARGFPAMTKFATDKLASKALDFLAATAPASAADLGRAYLSVSAPPMVTQAAIAATVPFADGPEAVFAHVREHLDTKTFHGANFAVDAFPIVKTLLARADDALRTAARTKLRELLAGPLDDRDGALAYVLTLLVPVDAEVIATWVSAPSPLLANYERAWKYPEFALPAFAEAFGRGRPNTPRMFPKQLFAAVAILERDPEEALRRARELLERPDGSSVASDALSALLEQLPKRRKLSTPEWHELLAAIEAKTSLGLGPAVGRVLTAWKVRAAPRAKGRKPK